jgi:hypothetical protein
VSALGGNQTLVEECQAPDTVFETAGGLIAVEYPMNYLRPLITKWNEALLGKTFPRRVTAPDGSARWQAATGRSFATFEEASNA